MKATVYDLKGTKKKEISLPAFFDAPIRKELVKRAVEYERTPQPYGLYVEAGRRHVASGIISHKRHDWKGQYGRGIARTPRKILWRRGTQFNWVGAEVSNTRGGRRPHGPKPGVNLLRMNKKEYRLALRSALAATAQESFLKERYETFDKHSFGLPIVVESGIVSSNTKTFRQFVNVLLGAHEALALRSEQVRAGKGKLRGRRYKRNAGALVLVGTKENVRIGGAEVCAVKNVGVSSLYPLGRIVIMTEQAVEEMKTL